MTDKSRKEKLKELLLDTTTEEIGKSCQNAIRRVINDIGDWISDQYEEFKNSSINKEEQLQKLQEDIQKSNTNIQIGMRKKEIAVMWAMRKLGYSQEETQKILELANQAYDSQDES